MWSGVLVSGGPGVAFKTRADVADHPVVLEADILSFAAPQ